MGSVTTQFRYAPDGGRYLQRTTGAAVSPTAKTVYYVEKDYERIVWSSGAVEEKTYMGPSVAIYRNGAMRDVRYLHRDGEDRAQDQKPGFAKRQDGAGEAAEPAALAAVTSAPSSTHSLTASSASLSIDHVRPGM